MWLKGGILSSNTNKVILFGVLFFSMRTFVGSFSSIYSLTKGVTVVEFGFIKSFLSMMLLLLDIPTSYFFDKRSYSLSLQVACVMCIAYFTMSYFATGFYSFLVAEFFNAGVLAMITGAYSSLLFNIAKSEDIEFSSINAVYQKMNNVGMLITAIIGSAGVYYLQQNYQLSNYYEPFYALSAICFVIMFGLSFYLLKSEKELNVKNKKPGKDSNAYSMKKLIKLIYHDKGILKFSLFIRIFNGSLMTLTMQSYQPLLFMLDDKISGLQLMLVYAGVMIAQFTAGHWFANKILVKNLLRLQTVMIGVSAVVFGWFSDYYMLQIVVLSIDIFLMYFMVRHNRIAVQGLILENLDSHLKSSTLSLGATTSRLMSMFFIIGYFWLIHKYHLLALVPFMIVANILFYIFLGFILKHGNKA